MPTRATPRHHLRAPEAPDPRPVPMRRPGRRTRPHVRASSPTGHRRARVDHRLIVLVWAVVGLLRPANDRRAGGRRRLSGASGQATTEYALVLLAAALVALLVVGWATAGGGAARIGALFNRVIDAVIDRV